MTAASLADITESDPLITWRDMLLFIRRPSMRRGYIDSHVLHRQFMRHNVDSSVFHWLPHIIDCSDRFVMLQFFHDLRYIHNGFQIFYRCIRETQDIPGHRIFADGLEEQARMSKCKCVQLVTRMSELALLLIICL